MPTSPPYALSLISFRFAALAAQAGRSQMGGQREVALATYVVARLAQDTLTDRGLPAAARSERAASARTWLASIALPVTVRAPLGRVVDASAEGSASSAAAIRGVTAVTANYLDSGARSELAQLASVLESQALAG